MARSRHASNTNAKSDEQIVDCVSARREVNVGCWAWAWAARGISGGKWEMEEGEEVAEAEVAAEVSGGSRRSYG